MPHYDEENGGQLLSVFDLPQLYTKPSADVLLETLSVLTSEPPSWDNSDTEEQYLEATPKAIARRRKSSAAKRRPLRIDNQGMTRYLTTIIGSDLRWIQDEDIKEEIWEQTSLRLSERSGRSAMPAMSRTFRIPTSAGSIKVSTYEPALTADNLGLKTWASSYVLAKRLHLITLPAFPAIAGYNILELGSGTGLVGMAAAAIFGGCACLTDLPEIEPNLTRNVLANRDAVEQQGGSMTTSVLDWTRPDEFEIPALPQVAEPASFPVIVAADFLYSAEHPKLFVQTVGRWLSRSKDGRVITELPYRDAYAPEIGEFKERMQDMGLEILEQGEETGRDDWGSEDSASDVRCWWAVWSWRPKS